MSESETNLVTRLEVEALEAARFRNHRMSMFTMVSNDYRVYGYDSTCLDCGMDVRVNPHPAPNQIDIGGEAVALNCKETNRQ